MTPENFELVTWADIKSGDHVWSMGGVCLITGDRFRNDDAYDQGMSPGFMRFPHRNESGSEFAPPMELESRVPRLIPPKPGTWTVIGVWVEDQAIVTGTIPGTHPVYGGDDYDAFPQGCWATSATAPDPDTAESMAVDEMMATLDHDDGDDGPQP
jgi:hypothetical protein